MHKMGARIHFDESLDKNDLSMLFLGWCCNHHFPAEGLETDVPYS